jgi:CRP-like cAMP-binding protein
MDETEAFLEALRELEGALDRSIKMHEGMKRRARELQDALRKGRPLAELVPEEKHPLLVQLLSEAAAILHSYGNTVRRTEARALRQQGMTMDQIAHLFGVTRQRISTLLRERQDAGGPA